MQAYLFLALAITAELFGTSMLKASQGFTKLWPSIGVIVGFGVAFYSLSASLQQIPLSIAYAIWSGVGTAITAIIGVVIWKESGSISMVIGITLIIAGVVILNLKSFAH
ncbi:multidrug efflux SMR transporter [Priestia flexa]|jgi:small multidrug resistance pump|uniref:Multidrug efflux SMR transporter n=1 Tax=Priestia flexa TaxID=86664 RepID=A0A1N6QTQ7_9BACI|nr:multidrug efflux SMR transporter [Priestia flexa]AQX54423.1 quaternary ammonium transporter [Priestia flexa]MBN8251933.1 multidrug efflux SMR transporter [Priestia flexa]MBN8435435.1 multidrug efflux SMR transporter [Priestia flexa]MBY6085475.1 multidrug efflux SMR transporter [Priestia flexa]MCA0967989.1 multidrug efflux SMR transporter [Priestia flexa]